MPPAGSHDKRRPSQGGGGVGNTLYQVYRYGCRKTNCLGGTQMVVQTERGISGFVGRAAVVPRGYRAWVLQYLY